MDKKEIRRAAARLKQLGRMVPVGQSDEQRLRDATQALRSEDTYQAAEECQECRAAQAQAGDETALCQEHLRRAMGL